jgi:hypothetical protein
MIINDSARIGADIDTASIQGGHKGIRAVTGTCRAAVRVLPGTAKKWASGGRKVPAPVAIILRLMLAGELTIEQLESVKP